MDSDCIEIDPKYNASNNADIQTDEIESVDMEGAGGKRKRKERSVVWKCFTKGAIIGKNKVQCTCNKCNALFTYDSGSGTGNLIRHMDKCYGKLYHDVGQMLFSGDLELRSSRFNQNTFRDMVVAATVRHELPLSFVDYKGIRDIFIYLQPEAKVVTRNTVRSDLLKLYKIEKEKIKSMLMESPGMLCLTSDLWTSIATDGYLAITVHFIDKQWILQKRVLAFSFMPPPHSGVSLNAKVFSILEEWGIEKKIFCVTLDNASSNDRFVELLSEQLDTKSPLISKGKFFHMRCCAHILNLIVQEGLKKIDQSVCKVRESVKYVKGSHSQVRKQKFLDCVKLLSLNSKRGLRQDVPTRWNSTFIMLDSAIYYRKAFSHLELSDSNFKSCPSASEWDTIEKLCVFLGVFFDVTTVFSGTKYPTANLYYPHIFMAYLTLHESMSSRDKYMKAMASSMMEKFQKYWSDFNLTLAIAVVFDPRYKLQFIEWSYKKVYGEWSTQYDNVDRLLFTTFDEYVVLNAGNGSSTTSNPVSSSSASKVAEELSDNTRRPYGVKSKLLDFDQFQSEEFTTSNKSELKLYLEEPRMERTLELDVLAFWRANEFRYPILARMARDFLTIPISTVASESTFSASGRVLDQHRSALSKDIVEALICTKDWLFADSGSNETDLDQLTEDIMALDVSPESDASNLVNNSDFVKKD